mgnify:CR=1 FL=1
MRKERWPACAVLVFAAALAVCLAAGLLVAASQAWLPAARLPLGYSVYACAHSQPGGPRLEIGWSLPQLMSSVIPGRPPRPGCLYLPWLPVLPPTGIWRIP